MKGVSGGLRVQIDSSRYMDKGGEDAICKPACTAQGSGSGMTKADFERANKVEYEDYWDVDMSWEI